MRNINIQNKWFNIWDFIDCVASVLILYFAGNQDIISCVIIICLTIVIFHAGEENDKRMNKNE